MQVTQHNKIPKSNYQVINEYNEARERSILITNLLPQTHQTNKFHENVKMTILLPTLIP